MVVGTSQVEMKHKPEKILIKTPNWLGDSVMSIPAVKGVKKLYPQAELWVYSKSNLAGLWRLIPEVKEVITFVRGEASHKRDGFGLVIILTNSFGSALRMFLAGIPQRKGYKRNARSWLLTQPVGLKKGWQCMHQIEYFLGLIGGNLDSTPSINIPSGLQDKAREFLKGYGWQYGEPVIGIHATASYGPAKCWLPERFAELIKELKNPWILMCGSRDEGKAIEGILGRLSNRERIVNIAGKTDIAELAGLISLCRVFIANDSGPMHLASAVGIPVVAIFGSTDPNRTGPRGRAVIVKKDIPCSPCFRRRCPRQLECMQLIGVEEVMKAVEEFL